MSKSKPCSRRPGKPATDAAPDQSADEAEDDAVAGPGYAVGYKRPPLHSRFAPGQSGNPKGRPKRTRSLEEMAGEELRKQRKVSLHGRTARMPVLKIMLASVAERAMRGDIAAFRALMPVMLRFFDAAEDSEALGTLPEEDRQLLDSYMEKIWREKKDSDERGGS